MPIDSKLALLRLMAMQVLSDEDRSEVGSSRNQLERAAALLGPGVDQERVQRVCRAISALLPLDLEEAALDRAYCLANPNPFADGLSTRTDTHSMQAGDVRIWSEWGEYLQVPSDQIWDFLLAVAEAHLKALEAKP